jgi:hypothetical protein
MSEKENVFRVPVPKNNVEYFIGMVYSFSELCGINKIPELHHQIELLARAADVHLYEKDKGPVKNPVNDEKKRFISSFKNRFLVNLGYEYPNTIKPLDSKMIDQFISGKISQNHIDADFYLAWFFDDYLEERQYLNPPEFTTAVSSKAWNTFIYDNKDAIKTKKEEFMQQSESINLINRARVVARSTEDMEIRTKVLEILKKFRDKGIMIAEFRKEVQILENQIKSNQ